MTRLVYPGNDPENGPAYDPDAVDKRGRKLHDKWGNRIYRRVDGRPYIPDVRKQKRDERLMGMADNVEAAYYLGCYHAEFRKTHHKGNPYPPGRRHDAYEQGAHVDLLGHYHGENR
jgi:hypothetical protein